MSETAANTDADYEDWVGQVTVETDEMPVRSLDRMSRTLDRDDPDWRAGDPVPPMWHMMCFPMDDKLSKLGADGLPERGGTLPPIPLPRRMFAGARLTHHRPIKAGEALRRETRIDSITRKQGRSGELVFLKTVGEIYGEDRERALTEEQDIVYRGLESAARADTANPSSIAEPRWRRTISPSPVLLFRYSALVFNPHRIHYDEPYTTGVEGYPGLLVHGPLIATFLSELARDSVPDRPIHRFAYRAMRPLFATDDFEVVGALTEDGKGARVEALDPEGNVAMAAEVEFAV